MFIIPDEYLESMTCDVCHKFLSATPVKVYPNRRIKCGRCSQDGDAGVVSQYGLVVEQGLFKCVNIFDGCRKLLKYDQVVDHEVICHSKPCICPVCPETTEIPTFLLIKHFEDRHKDCLLKMPSFRAELGAPCTKTYLYRVKDNLFFIEFKNTLDDSISLNAIFLGHQLLDAEEVSQDFIVYFGDDPNGYATERKTCAENSEGFILKKPNIQINFLFVTFRLTLGSLESIEQNKTIGIPRTLSLGENCDSKFSLGSSSTSILVLDSEKKHSKFIMYCINCSLPAMLPKDTLSFIEIKPEIYHLICIICESYYRKQSPNIRIIKKPSLLKGLKPSIGYSCLWKSWGCLSTSEHSSLFSHEANCQHQPPRPCPVPNCLYFGKLCDLRSHSLEVHPDEIIIVTPFTILRRSPVQPFKKCYYLWAYHCFIHLEVCDNGNCCKISLFPQDNEGSSNRPKPRALIWEDDNKTLIGCEHFFHESKAQLMGILCFLEF